MQIPLPIFSVHGLDGVKAYVAASDAYLTSTAHRRAMQFSFPDIQHQCPLCRTGGCARWKGYYVRGMQDATLSFIGPLVIRYGRCRRFKSEFSFLPDFLLPRRRLAIPTLALIRSALVSSSSKTVQAAIDSVVSPDAESDYIPVSTAHSTLQFLTWLLRISNFPFTISRRLWRRLSEPESFGSVMGFSIANVLKISTHLRADSR
jgi:hypothetical protein